MSSKFFPEHLMRALCLLALLGGLLAGAAAAAPAQAVLPFTAETWNELGRSPLRPLAVVFSTTDCVHCPAAIEHLAEAIRSSRFRVRLAVVVMDGAGQHVALGQERHYRQAAALYAFDGDAMALRYTVNPDWRGLTPYVALIPAAGATQFHTGAPPPAALRAFLRR